MSSSSFIMLPRFILSHSHILSLAHTYNMCAPASSLIHLLHLLPTDRNYDTIKYELESFGLLRIP